MGQRKRNSSMILLRRGGVDFSNANEEQKVRKREVLET